MKREIPPLEIMAGSDLFDKMLEGSLSEDAKREIAEWLWSHRLLDDKQYKLAVNRIEHLEKKKS